MLIDSHTHLYEAEFGGLEEQADTVRRAIEAGVDTMVFPCIDEASVAPMKALAERFPTNIRLAVGLHPENIDEKYPASLDFVARELDGSSPYCAVGEIGIDLYWDKTWREQQIEAFYLQCRMAADRDLPVVIHCREALPEVLDVLASLYTVPRGVMHSFGGTPEDVEAVRRVAPEMYFGINGIVTFKNSRLRDTLPAIGLDKILLETDAPYLAPVPRRGRRNESAYLPYIADTVATALGLPLGQVAAATTASARTIFRL